MMEMTSAPPTIDKLFRLYLQEGRPLHLHRALLEMIEPYGDGTWLIGSCWAFRTIRAGKRRSVEFEKVSKVLAEGEGT